MAILPVEVSNYPYHPVKGVSTLFIILFAISGAVHIYQNTRYKSWALLWLLPCCSIIFTAGFICLEYNAFHPNKDGDAAPSQGLLFSTVPILSACLCLILYRLIAAQSSTLKLWRTTTWVLFSVFTSATISLTAQGAASFFDTTAKPSSIRAGLTILRVSLVILLVSTICFLGLLAMFQHKYPKIFTEISGRKIKNVFLTLCAEAALILVRNIFRVVQIFLPYTSSVWTSEVFFWVFDVLPLFICMALLNVLHPGKMLLETPYVAC